MAIDRICDALECTGCGACVQLCPKSAIQMIENTEGFRYPQIDAGKCIECAVCVKSCPTTHDTPKHEAEFFMAWNRDPKILRTSSSGGVFTALARYVFRRGGVVFGAVKDAVSWEVLHVAARDERELEPLKLSKYYQSDAARVYSQVKAELNDGNWVLFSGTACQIAGLYAYLGNRPWDTLITVDVLCHGVASKKVVNGYVQSKEKHFKKKIRDFDFRVKQQKVGWNSGGGGYPNEY